MIFSYCRPKVLLIGGSVNQTSICHEIAKHLTGNCDYYFTPFYTDHPLVVKALQAGLLDFTALGGKFRKQTDEYLAKYRLPVDFCGRLHNYVLVATSDLRETGRFDRRGKFIREAVALADGRPLIFKEIKRYAPDALILSDGRIGEMIANCDLLIAQYSSVVFIGLALKKKVYSYFDLSQLHRLKPVQNGGRSGKIIAEFCRNLICRGKSGVI